MTYHSYIVKPQIWPSIATGLRWCGLGFMWQKSGSFSHLWDEIKTKPCCKVFITDYFPSFIYLSIELFSYFWKEETSICIVTDWFLKFTYEKKTNGCLLFIHSILWIHENIHHHYKSHSFSIKISVCALRGVYELWRLLNN